VSALTPRLFFTTSLSRLVVIPSARGLERTVNPWTDEATARSPSPTPTIHFKVPTIR
jgi:hypothetical protein